MAIKFEDVRDSLDGLEDEHKKLYIEKDGKYNLDAKAALAYTTNMIEDQTGMKRNYDRLNEDVKKLRTQIKDYEEAKRLAEEEAKKIAEQKELDSKQKANDFEGYKESISQKHEADIRAREEKISELTQYIDKLTVEATAVSIASELAVQGSAPLLIPLVRSRLRTKYESGAATVEVLDEQGRPTVFTVEDLKKQIASDPSCSRIIKGSDATGGGHQSAAPSGVKVPSQGDGAQGATQRTKKYESAQEFAERQAKRIEELNNKFNVGG